MGATQSLDRVAPLVPTPVETEEVITPEECCFSLHKQRLALWQLMARGWGGGSSRGQRTPDNRINHMKNVTAPQMESLLTVTLNMEKNYILQKCNMRVVHIRLALLSHMPALTVRVLLFFIPLSKMIEEKA